MTAFEYFTIYIMPPLVICFGLLGNVCGILVISKKELLKIGPRDMYRYLFISDTAYLLFMIQYYVLYGFALDPTVLSKYVCKLFYYLSYTFAAISPWLLSIHSFLYFILLFMHAVKSFRSNVSFETHLIPALIISPKHILPTKKAR